MGISPDDYDVDLTGDISYTASGSATLAAVLAQADDELVVDLTNTSTSVFPEVPPWAENEAQTIEGLFSRGSIDKALDLLDANRVDEFKEGVWNVQGSELYVVHVFDNPYGGQPWTTCTCPNGTNRASRPLCYHAAAVLLTLEARTKD